MNFQIGSNSIDGGVPLLWGSRAVIQDKNGKLTIVDLATTPPKLEILGDRPAAGIVYTPTVGDGFTVLNGDRALYTYSPAEKTLTGEAIPLPQCQILEDSVRIGQGRFSGNVAVGCEVGLLVTEQGVGFGASMPPELARLAGVRC
jgi:hypothetical protein